MPTIAQLIGEEEVPLLTEVRVPLALPMSEVRLYVGTEAVAGNVKEALVCFLESEGMDIADLNCDVRAPGVVVDKYDRTRIWVRMRCVNGHVAREWRARIRVWVSDTGQPVSRVTVPRDKG